MNLSVLAKYSENLEKRYESFHYVFNKLASKKNNVIVELGTSRSFVSGGIPGCMSDNIKYWDENVVENWDWGAGLFTRICAEVIDGSENIFYTVDPDEKAMRISKAITLGYAENINYRLETSTDFLRNFTQKIDLLYMDHHETCEEGARLHLLDSQIIIDNDLLSKDALILIDDIHLENYKSMPGILPKTSEASLTPAEHYGKGTFSIPYLQSKGFRLLFEGYQIILGR
ncbi:class I SAM-dependent methyltransferase [Mucilaginibacter angelicae]|uniref:Class I SAM-dependent methyltransferase n=1 Tax=Mucilaginibacter angelicae TaxID=869718 RepID=A0ABV6L169_9SPHI